MSTQFLIVGCSACAAKNRVPVTRIEDSAKCGKCGQPLATDVLSQVVVVTDSSFNKQVLQAKRPVLVDCWAPWCGPCRLIGPVMDELAREYKGRLKIVKLNLDENPVTGSRYAISSVPTLMLIKQGQIMDTLVGVLPKEQIVDRIKRII